MDMIGRFLIEGCLLELLWEFCNSVFTDHVAEEPLKRGQPVTNDSNDPNGSLLQGLRAKKEAPRVSYSKYDTASRVNHIFRVLPSGSLISSQHALMTAVKRYT